MNCGRLIYNRKLSLSGFALVDCISLSECRNVGFILTNTENKSLLADLQQCLCIRLKMQSVFFFFFFFLLQFSAWKWPENDIRLRFIDDVLSFAMHVMILFSFSFFLFFLGLTSRSIIFQSFGEASWVYPVLKPHLHQVTFSLRAQYVLKIENVARTW